MYIKGFRHPFVRTNNDFWRTYVHLQLKWFCTFLVSSICTYLVHKKRLGTMMYKLGTIYVQK